MNIQMMERIAKMSPHKRYQHCSLIFVGSRLISYGYNRGGIHAEEVAINRLNAWLRNQRRRPRNLHMINFMIKRKTGNPGSSYPCDICLYTAVHNGIKTITYMDDNEWSQIGVLL